MPVLRRRQFMAGAISSLTVLATTTSALAPLRLKKKHNVDAFTFYDARFAEAHLLAQQIHGDEHPLPTYGDVTPVWQDWLGASSHRSGCLRLQGVTTESFPFCLRVLLESQNLRVEPTLTRFNRDLHIWTIETLPVSS